ncbi:THUMP domain-containing protein 2 isoform X2 [Hemicordylus capensis]|uniref:THUMP domain-containing protein 2 isoform X2 n=1 Tax=Hemicordylus capensis TaxID=884348 RepID=UPI002304AD6B|nr:THUMP domain-containing protein 2 isoform X2 [Hemicordylus capensis]
MSPVLWKCLVEYISGKVFFTSKAELNMLKELKSAERLFLLLNKSPPVSISRNKGKVIHDIQKLVDGDPQCWLDTITLWRRLHGQKVKQNMCPEYTDSQKRKSEDEESVKNKRQKREQTLETVSAESRIENQQRCDALEVYKDVLTGGKLLSKKTHEAIQKKSVESNDCFSFRVSCRCSGALAKVFTAQEMGRVIGIALMKHFGWKADLKNPDIEIFVHLNDIYVVIGIPVFRLPLASRAYIKTAGMRSTIAWAMASLAEIKAGAFVLDPTCGLGTILLEAAKEWSNVHYLGTDISDSQLQGAYFNIKAAGLMDKIELLKASVTALPLPSGSIDVIIADIPFGKKFKITKDMKLLPNVFQEIERVLCAGGTVVLLLSQELYNRLSSSSANSSETGNHISVKSAGDCTQSATTSIESNSREKSGSPRTILPPAQDAGREHTSHKTPLGSLVLVESFEVSLGKTDAFICKYKKIAADPARDSRTREVCIKHFGVRCALNRVDLEQLSSAEPHVLRGAVASTTPVSPKNL